MGPSVRDLLTASDFTPYLLNDMYAPVVTVILEEQALAPARVFARVPYLEHLLGLVQQGCESHQLPAACAPALERAHTDLATYLNYWQASSIRLAWRRSLMHWLTTDNWRTPRW